VAAPSLRGIGKNPWFAPLKDFIDQPTKKKALVEFRQLLYYRGSVPTKEGQASILVKLLEKEIARGFKFRGMYRTRLRYSAEGVPVRSEEVIRSETGPMREDCL